MAAGGITLEYLSYSGAKDNPGGGCRAVFDFQGSDGGSLYVGYTFQIGFDYEPKAVVLANNVLVEGLTGIITEVAHETASFATGKLEIYALQYGTTYDIATFDMSGTPMSDITFTPQANNSIKAKNLVSGTLADDITTSTTNILVHIADNISAQGITDFFPNPPFYITIMPKTPTIGVANRLDSEIIKITNVGHDQVGNAALTGVRAQRDTTAKAFSTGDIVTVGSYCDDAVFLSEDGTTEAAMPWITQDDVVWNNFGVYFAPGANNTAVTNNTSTQIASFTIPKAGNYLFIAHCGLSGGTINEFFTVTLKKGSTIIGETFVTIAGTTARPFAVVMAQSQCAAGDVIKLFAAAPGDNGTTLTRPNGIAIFRIG